MKVQWNFVISSWRFIFLFSPPFYLLLISPFYQLWRFTYELLEQTVAISDDCAPGSSNIVEGGNDDEGKEGEEGLEGNLLFFNERNTSLVSKFLQSFSGF